MLIRSLATLATVLMTSTAMAQDIVSVPADQPLSVEQERQVVGPEAERDDEGQRQDRDPEELRPEDDPDRQGHGSTGGLGWGRWRTRGVSGSPR